MTSPTKTGHVLLERLKRIVAKINATVEDDSVGKDRVLQVVAPDGKLWADGACIHLLIQWNEEESNWVKERDKAIADAIVRISYGLIHAEDEDCI